MVTLFDEADTEVHRRRRGKPLRGCIGIFQDTRFGMAGRIITYQVHPWECSTNYATLVAARCNADVQDLRRVLPPTLWMSPEDLEPVGDEQEGETYTHGAYPQRYKNFSLGQQDTWGWFQHLGTTEHAAHEAIVFTDWHGEFASLLKMPGAVAPASPADRQDADMVSGAAQASAVAAFVDAHNTSYYINSYTTKVNPTMDDVLSKLLDGLRRLRGEWSEREAEQAAAEEGSTVRESTRKGREDFRRTMQVLARFESSFRRASWKSGSEMVFPILFGHLSFMTHRCWTDYMHSECYIRFKNDIFL